ncbi:THUMP domain protein [Penicillium taxi]|uniref:THUMP domain protein n=1 Tax=Penicillium taxi TaxID=168475 RepID=UPI002545AD52|nr:THUMP domain protein [Penicillium taxi]KAJ5902785.1 THUMP domain protein [Penicillium taxi]
MGEKRNMPGNLNHSSKRRKGGPGKPWQQPRKGAIESGEWGVFVTCDMGRESKCIRETLDVFSQNVEDAAEQKDDDEDDGDEDDDDIEAQIRREIEGLQTSKTKSRPFSATQLDIPCVTFVRLDKSIEPVELVHRLCTEAQANPEKKSSRYIKRMTPVTEIRKTLSVDLEAFAREILKPHFHSGGPPKKYAILPTLRGNDKFKRDPVIKTIADVVGPEHPVDLKNYDLMILVTVVQNVIGMSVVGSDYDKLKRYNLAEIYDPSPKPTAETKS